MMIDMGVFSSTMSLQCMLAGLVCICHYVGKAGDLGFGNGEFFYARATNYTHFD